MSWDPLGQLTDDQRQKLLHFEELLLHFNRRLNLISREDEGSIFGRHILHSLSLTHKSFPDGALVVDWGTGGGLPAIPLAVAFPRVQFIGVDAVGKKSKAVKAMSRRLGIENLDVWWGRAEEFEEKVDYSVSRATAPLGTLWSWHRRSARDLPSDSDTKLWHRGVVCLKGGDLSGERRELPPDVHVHEIRLESLLGDSHFEDKCILECYQLPRR